MEQDFTVVQLREHIYQIGNDAGNCATLVLGEQKAILFDTMCGLGDLKICVEGLTKLPVTVINSHGHYDHVGGNYQFDICYISPLELPVLEINEAYLDEVQKNMGCDLSAARKSFAGKDRFLNLESGMVFDLGGIHAEAVALPAHTAGSIGLLLKEDKILLAGDAISPQMCLFFHESGTVDEYIQTLENIMGMDIEYFIQGHFLKLFPKSLLEKFRKCAELPKKRKKGHEYINTNMPECRGMMYILEFGNEDAGGIICIITKENICLY